MKKLICLICAMMLCATSLSAFDLNDLFNNSSNKQGNAADLVNGIISSINASKIEYKDLKGKWDYDAPAITFTSDNLLQNAGGVAVSGTIVNKLRPYYTKAGIDNLTLEFANDSTFIAKSGKIVVRGSVKALNDGMFQFNFKAFGKIPTGSINAYAEKRGENICLTLDAKKLVELAQTIASLSQDATLKKAAELINSYEGINIGVNMKKQ